MKKMIILGFIAIFVLVGCSQNPYKDTEPDVEGLIYNIQEEDNRFLVVADIEDVDVPYDQWFEAGNYAVEFRVDDNTIIKRGKTKLKFSDLEKGQRIKVWHTGVLAESYPMQGEAVYIEIVD